MPLPPALLARLQKRGIIKQDEAASTAAADKSKDPQRVGKAGGAPASGDKQPLRTGDEGEDREAEINSDKEVEEEEVFAEHRDDDEGGGAQKSSGKTPGESVKSAKSQEAPKPAAVAVEDEADCSDPEFTVFKTAKCPNRHILWHDCGAYCFKRWGRVKFSTDKRMLARRDFMLHRFPLPPDWFEVADPTTNRFYYWNSVTDQVSWLAPGHPRASVTQAAEKLRLEERRRQDQQMVVQAAAKAAELEATRAAQQDASATGGGGPGGSDEDEEDGRDEEGAQRREHRRHRRRRHSSSSSDEQRHHRHRRRRHHRRHRRSSGGSGGEDVGGGGGGGTTREKRPVDPMDPSAYSDAPRGDWSSGLEAARGRSGGGKGKDKSGKEKTKGGKDAQPPAEVTGSPRSAAGSNSD